jgi:hypothetical protein
VQTAATPLFLARFSGSGDILAGTTITGYANDNGKVTVTTPR